MKALRKWIEVTGHFDHYTDGEFVFDCELPEDGQEILITLTGGYICRDICYIDKMGYHLYSGWDWDDDVLKWAPMPPAWWEENAHSRKGVFIPDITVEMFRNASLEGVEDLLASGEMEDISLPSAQPEHTNSWYINSWCIDCKEYDTENKCCPRYNRVIKQTLDDAYRHGETEAEARFHDEIVRCKDCKHQVKEWRTDKRLKDNGYMVCGCDVVGDACGYWALLGQDDDYCSMAERRTDGRSDK